MSARPNVRAELEALMRQRILVIDGAMGTTIRGYGLKEADARGERFKNNMVAGFVSQRFDFHQPGLRSFGFR